MPCHRSRAGAWSAALRRAPCSRLPLPGAARRTFPPAPSPRLWRPRPPTPPTPPPPTPPPPSPCWCPLRPRPFGGGAQAGRAHGSVARSDAPSVKEVKEARMHYRSVFRPRLFEGQVIVITGGGSGIGRCTAHELASLGARLALAGRTGAKLQAVQAEIAAAAPEAAEHVSTHVCDIRDEDAVRDTVGAVLARHGRIDGLFNNAGGQFPAPLRAISRK